VSIKGEIMGKFLDYFKKDQLTEEIKAFEERPKPKLVDIVSKRGEGWESTQDMDGVGNISVQSFNLFYNTYINKQYENEVNKIHFYRQMSNMPEIADVIEDAVNESTQVDEDGRLIHLEIKDKDLSSNENIVKNINSEFHKLFNKNIKTETELWNMFRNYFIDGRIYYERIVDSRHPKQGIIGIKTLPSETMDYIYNPLSGKISSFFQYLKPNSKRPLSLEEARSRKDIVLFNESQIGFINYGIYGASKYEIFGFLEKSKVPYNQLKLLETSVIIYRIIRAPERLVFKIDTGNMPRDKALKYTEKIKKKMTKKQSYNSATGELSQEPEVLSMLENYYLPQSAEGRGSSIESVGGNATGFTELDDVYYFARKLYRALKYPSSRVSAGQEKTEGDIVFGGGSTGEISRDEIKWSKFLERQQRKFCEELTDLFLLHLEFRGLKKIYELDNRKISINLNPPSKYKEQMEANFIESRHNNYSSLADREEMSKYYCIKKYLKWNDEEIQANRDGMKKDIEYGFRESNDM
jgi:hypothetical protein